MLEDALRYPWDDGDAVEELLVGSLLTLLGFLIFPLVLVSGYTLRVVRDVAGGEPSPPAWTDWAGLLVDGLKVWVVSIVYVGVPGIVVFGAVGLFFVPVASNASTAVSAVVGIVAALFVLVAMVALVAAWYVLPAALARLAVTGRLGAAFSPRPIWGVLTASPYVKAWLLALGVGVLGSVVSSVLASTLVGGILVPVVGFYTAVSASHLLGTGYGRAVGDLAATTGDGDGEAANESDGETGSGSEDEVADGDVGGTESGHDESTGGSGTETTPGA